MVVIVVEDTQLQPTTRTVTVAIQNKFYYDQIERGHYFFVQSVAGSIYICSSCLSYFHLKK